MSNKITKLKDKVEMSGDLATQMFNFIAYNGKYADVNRIIAQFNYELKDFTEVVELSDEEDVKIKKSKKKNNEKED